LWQPSSFHAGVKNLHRIRQLYLRLDKIEKMKESREKGWEKLTLDILKEIEKRGGKVTVPDEIKKKLGKE